LDKDKKPEKPKKPEGIKNVIAVASGKGGVGKSTVAVNLASGLASKGISAGLLDADIYGPSVPNILGVKGEPVAENKKIKPIIKNGIKIMSIGFMLKEEDAVIWRGPLMSSAIKQFVNDVEWGGLDYLVVDLPPGTGDASITVAQVLPPDGVIIVTTPQAVAAKIAAKAVSLFRKMDIPVLGAVENMSSFTCPKCGEKTRIFPESGRRYFEEKTGIEIITDIPMVEKMNESLTKENKNIIEKEFEKIVKYILNKSG